MAGPQINRVALPWAAYQGHVERDDEKRADKAHRDSAELKVGALAVTPDALDAAGGGGLESEGARRLRRDIPPELRAAGLPVDPLPSIPEEDRGVLEDESAVTLAVALDVLTTITRGMEGDDTILQQLTRALLYVGELGGMDAKIDSLVEYAESGAANQRQRLSLQLARCLGESSGNADETAAGVAPTTPDSVAEAVRHIETAGREVVGDAVLLMHAHAPVDYFRS